MVCTRLISGVNAINLLVALYDIHGRKREVFFYFVKTISSGLKLEQKKKYYFLLHLSRSQKIKNDNSFRSSTSLI
jgi:hypothetical protein